MKPYFLIWLDLYIIGILLRTSFIINFIISQNLINFKISFQFFMKLFRSFKCFLINNILPIRSSYNSLRYQFLVRTNNFCNNLDIIKYNVFSICLINHTACLTTIYNLWIFQYIRTIIWCYLSAYNCYSIIKKHKMFWMLF